MSSKVPIDLLPIEEDRREFLDPSNQDFNDLIKRDYTHSSVPSDRLSDSFDSDGAQKFAGVGLEITSTVIGNLISHPCIVLRRQCQVNQSSIRYHLSPFTLVPVLIRLHNRQGIKCLWKGASGIFIIRGCAAALETFIAELTPFPREVSSSSSIKQLGQHILLKFITYGILTPFYCASLVEIVQSDIASEKPGVFDCLKEGICRLFKWGTPHSSRLLPIWKLVIPTAAYGLSFYILSSLVQSVIRWFVAMKHRSQTNLEYPLGQNSAITYLDNISSSNLGSFTASIVLYPAETVLHRLYLQGTRTIIDNLDMGISVLPVVSKYEGAADCFHTIVTEEGAAGLYKGFGALILEFALQTLIVKFAKFTFEEIEHLLKGTPEKKAKDIV